VDLPIKDPEDYLQAARERDLEEGYTAFQRRVGALPNRIFRWRNNVPGFKRAEKQIKERWARKLVTETKKELRKQEASAVIAEAQELKERRTDLAILRRHAEQFKAPESDGATLNEHQETFLRAMEEHDDRVAALAISGVTWQVVQTWARESKDFHARYLAIMSKWVVGVEDATMRKAKGGNIRAAQMYLQAHDPARYSPRVKIEHSGSVAVTAEGVEHQRQQWLAKFSEGDRVLEAIEVANGD
jgi:hypothetical protein